MKNHCVGLRPAPPLAEARVTQLASASFRDLNTTKATVPRKNRLQLRCINAGVTRYICKHLYYGCSF